MVQRVCRGKWASSHLHAGLSSFLFENKWRFLVDVIHDESMLIKNFKMKNWEKINCRFYQISCNSRPWVVFYNRLNGSILLSLNIMWIVGGTALWILPIQSAKLNLPLLSRSNKKFNASFRLQKKPKPSKKLENITKKNYRNLKEIKRNVEQGWFFLLSFYSWWVWSIKNQSAQNFLKKTFRLWPSLKIHQRSFLLKTLQFVDNLIFFLCSSASLCSRFFPNFLLAICVVDQKVWRKLEKLFD